jgi:hypothetical protein
LPSGFPRPDHLLTVGIEGVVDDPLGAVDLMVVTEAEMAEAFGDGFQAASLRLADEPGAGYPVHLDALTGVHFMRGPPGVQQSLG